MLALASGRPVLALAMHSKMERAMIEMGQEAFLFQADDVSAERLIEGFEKLEAERAGVSAALRERAAARRALLEHELDQLFGRRRDRMAIG